MNGLGDIIAQLERQGAAIERAIAALREIEGSAAIAKGRGRPPGKKRGGKRHMSAESRARIGEPTRRRWAEKKAGAKKRPTAAKKQGTKKRSMSPEGRARIAEAARRMWAARKKAGRKKGGE